MGRGCVAWLAQWAALAALYWLGLRYVLPPALRIPPLGGWIAALALGLSLRLALGAFGNAARSAEDRRVLARCRAGVLPQDGKRFAAAGPIAALAAPLEAPFSRTPCVAYRYRIGGGDPGGADAGGVSAPAYAGLALTPAAIQAPGASVRLLGFPFLGSGFVETPAGGETAFANAAAYVAATAFDELELADVGKLVGESVALLADAQGALRRDWRVGGREGIARGDRLAESVVPEGEEVSAIGLYRAAEGGLAPDLSPGGRPLRLLRGGADAAAAALARDGRGKAAWGVALLLAPHAILAAFLLLRPR